MDTAKKLLGPNSPELTQFVARLLDDMANLKAMLQAMSIGAWRSHAQHSQHRGTAPVRCMPCAAPNVQWTGWEQTAGRAHVMIGRARINPHATWQTLVSRRMRSSVRSCISLPPCSRHVDGGVLRLRGGPRRAVERAAVRAVLQAAGRGRRVSSAFGMGGVAVTCSHGRQLRPSGHVAVGSPGWRRGVAGEPWGREQRSEGNKGWGFRRGRGKGRVAGLVPAAADSTRVGQMSNAAMRMAHAAAAHVC